VIEPGQGIPPAVALLLNEEFSLLERTQARRKLRGMIRELKDQTLAQPESYLFERPEPDTNPTRFRVFMDGGLDLFSRAGACSQLPCRLSYADQIARSVALMADDVWFTDHITERVLSLRRPTNAQLDWLLDDVYLLQRLRPLVDAGLVRFRSSMRSLCTSCLSEFDVRLETLTAGVLGEFRQRVKIEKKTSDLVYVRVSEMYDPPIVLLVVGDAAQGSEQDILKLVLRRCVRQTLWTAGDAAFGGGSVFSNSKVGLSGILAEEGRALSGPRLTALEGLRAGNLPWIAGLTIEQTIQLRQEAAQALPRLREFLARHLAARPHHDDRRATDAADYVAELREQAAEVQAELTAASAGHTSLARSALGVLSLCVFAYGFSAEPLGATAGLFQLLTTLGLLHQLNSPDTQHGARLRSKPGYVLVAAQSILAHAK
jgi:hypothetical protein